MTGTTECRITLEIGELTREEVKTLLEKRLTAETMPAEVNFGEREVQLIYKINTNRYSVLYNTITGIKKRVVSLIPELTFKRLAI